VQQRKRFPKEGKTVKTPEGLERVIAVDIFRERVTLRADDGEHRILTLAELHAEAAEAGAPLPAVTLAPAPAHVDESDEHSFDEPELEAEVPADAPLVPKSAQAGPVPGEGVTVDEKGERKPHRRRGRRGGRRNRPGGRGPREGNDEPGAADGGDTSGEGAE
jgi:hypothetical protein